MPTGRIHPAARLVLPLLIAAILLAGAVLPESPRVFQVLVLAAMLTALWEAGARLARWLVPDFGPASRGVAAFTFAVGVAVVPATWLGHFGWLRPAPFLIWTAAAFLLSLLLPNPEKRAEEESPSPASSSTKIERIDLALLIMAALAIALVGLYDMGRLRWAPAGPHGFDDVSYHLSAVATWIRYGDLRMIRFSMGDPSTPFYPILGEMASWVLIVPFRDSDVAARWTQVFFAVFSFLAVAAIARRLGLSRRGSAFAAIAYAGIYHVFPVLSVSAGNDQSTSFFTLAGIDAALALARRPRPGRAVVAGAALGSLLATKYIGVLFTPLILVVLALVAWIERRREPEERAPARTLAGAAALLALTMAITGGYTYLRNAVTTGNPIFPAPVEILGIEIFPGWGGITTAERADAPEFDIDVWEFLTRQSKLFGSYFPFTLLPAALLGPFLALGRRRWRAALTFTLPALIFLQFLYLMPDHRDIRYFLPAIALAAVAFAWLLAEAGPRIALPVRGVLLAWITLQAVRHVGQSGTKHVLAGLVVVAVGILLERFWGKGMAPAPPFRPWMRWVAAGVFAAVILRLGSMAETYQQKKFANLAPALALDEMVGARGARVAYAGFNQPYFFFGGSFQNGLEIVPRNRALEARHYRWGVPLVEPYTVGSYRRWRVNLEKLGVGYVVVVRSPWEDPERRWMKNRSEDFDLAWANAQVEIWRVVPPPSPPGSPGYNPRDAEPADHRR